MNGHLKIAEMLIEKSAELNIDLNAKGSGGRTAFHWTCWGHTNLAEMFMQKSAEFNIDLNTKQNADRTTVDRKHGQY